MNSPSFSRYLHTYCFNAEQRPVLKKISQSTVLKAKLCSGTCQVRCSSGWPDWANFRLPSGCFHWAVFWELQKLPKFLQNLWATLSGGAIYCTYFGKNWVGLHFGRIFSRTQLVTLMLVLTTCKKNYSNETTSFASSGAELCFKNRPRSSWRFSGSRHGWACATRRGAPRSPPTGSADDVRRGGTAPTTTTEKRFRIRRLPAQARPLQGMTEKDGPSLEWYLHSPTDFELRDARRDMWKNRTRHERIAYP
jgi:hypothetical protein